MESQLELKQKKVVRKKYFNIHSNVRGRFKLPRMVGYNKIDIIWQSV